MCVCIYVCVHLPKAERKVKLGYYFPLQVIFILFLFQRELLCMGRGQGFFFLLFFLHIFLSPCLLVLRVIIHQGLFNCQTQQKVIRPLLFPAPTPAFSSDKSSLCWVVSSFHKDPSSSHKLETLFYFISRQPLMNVWRLGMLQLMLCPWTISNLTN